MKNAVTIRLGQDLDRMLTKFCHLSKRKRSEAVRDALRRQLLLMMFEQLRHKVMPLAEARGFLTDEAVFKAVEASGLTITDPRGFWNLVKNRQENQLIAVGTGSVEKNPFPSRSWQDTYDMLLGCGRSSNLFRRLESQCPAPSFLWQFVALLPV